MTVGKDVSGLFPDVLKNMQTEDIEQKKLVYLYLMNYAKTQPELVILAVNTFVKVSWLPQLPDHPSDKLSGLRGSQSPCAGFGDSNDGMSSSRKDYRLPFWPSSEVPP
jgi:hypothetical protein